MGLKKRRNWNWPYWNSTETSITLSAWNATACHGVYVRGVGCVLQCILIWPSHKPDTVILYGFAYSFHPLRRDLQMFPPFPRLSVSCFSLLSILFSSLLFFSFALLSHAKREEFQARPRETTERVKRRSKREDLLSLPTWCDVRLLASMKQTAQWRSRAIRKRSSCNLEERRRSNEMDWFDNISCVGVLEYR